MSLLDKHNIDILFIQETWLLPSNLYKLADIHKDYLFHGQSGIVDTELLQGRPYGGVAILWHKKLAGNIVKIKDCGSKRICAVKLCCKQKNILLVSCYMPNDNYHKHYVSEDFITVCDTLECLISKYKDCDVIVGGDMNIDYKRNNAHANYFSHFLNNCDMMDCWSLAATSQDCFTYCDHFNHTSCIDRFSISSQLRCCFKDIHVKDCALNPSNHRPVCMLMDIEISVAKSSAARQSECSWPIAWHCIDQEHPSVYKYKHDLDLLLYSIPQYEVNMCKDAVCENTNHKMQINDMRVFLVNCCIQAVFPKNKPVHCIIPG